MSSSISGVSCRAPLSPLELPGVHPLVFREDLFFDVPVFEDQTVLETVNPLAKKLRDGHRWLRLAHPDRADPLDSSYGERLCGRWNPPYSSPTLYLNEYLDTARAQVYALLGGSPVKLEDLDAGFDLVVAALPRFHDAADAVTNGGSTGLGPPTCYPRHRNGRPIRHETCQAHWSRRQGRRAEDVHARSAATADGAGREVAWFPARSTSRATLKSRLAFRDWWYEPVVP